MEPVKPRINYRLEELAKLLHAELRGDGSTLISGVNGIDSATPDQLTFLANTRYNARARTTQAGAVLVSPQSPDLPLPTLRVADPYLAFAEAVALFHQAPSFPPGIHPTAVIAPNAQLGSRVHVGAYAVIMEGCVVGDDSVLLPHTCLYPGVQVGARLLMHSHAVIRENCRLGEDVILQNGVIVGGDGFGFARRADGSWQKIPQSGQVLIGDRVEIQANACIDRASVGETRIAAGTKIDNLVQVGHGSTIGTDSLLCAQVGLAGSTTVGNQVILAGQVGVAGHCIIGDRVVATAQSGIPNDVPAGLTVSGYPAVENRQWLKSVALLNRLPAMIRNLKREPK